MLSAPLSVPGPGHRLREAEAGAAAFQEADAGVGEVGGQDCADDAAQVQDVFRIAHQQDLKKPVGQVHRVAVQVYQPGDAGGVCGRAEEEVPLQRLPVGLHRRVDGAQAVQPPQPLQHIGQMPQGLLGFLGRVITHVGEGPEGRHIGEKLPLPEGPQVQGHRAAPSGLLRRLQRVGGQAQAVGHVVAGAHGDVTQRPALRQAHQPGADLAEGAVPAHADQALIVPAVRGGQFRGVSGMAGEVHGGQPARPGQALQHPAQRRLGRALPRPGIHQQHQRPFHVQHPASSFFLKYSKPMAPLQGAGYVPSCKAFVNLVPPSLVRRGAA